MRTYFIDVENVPLKTSLVGINMLTAKDEIHIFYSDKCKTINGLEVESFSQMMNSHPKICIHPLIKSGPNAMDFELVATMGYLVGRYPSRHDFYVISKDNGYSHSLDRLREIHNNDKFSIKQFPSIAQSLGYNLDGSPIKRVPIRDQIIKILKPVGKETLTTDGETIIGIICNSTSETNLRLKMCEFFGSNRGKDICGKIKDKYNADLINKCQSYIASKEVQ